MNVHNARLMLNNIEKSAARNMGLECDERIVWGQNGMMKKDDCDTFVVFSGSRSRTFYSFDSALEFLARA